MRWEKITVIRTLILVLAGFVAFAYAGFLLHQVAGWAVVGAELLLLAYLTDPLVDAGQVRR